MYEGVTSTLTGCTIHVKLVGLLISFNPDLPVFSARLDIVTKFPTGCTPLIQTYTSPAARCPIQPASILSSNLHLYPPTSDPNWLYASLLG